jgi:hypothetical protein
MVKIYRLGDHEGSSVSITTRNAPEKLVKRMSMEKRLYQNANGRG